MNYDKLRCVDDTALIAGSEAKLRDREGKL